VRAVTKLSRKAAFGALSVALLLTACGGGSDGADTDEADTDEAAADEAAADETAADDPASDEVEFPSGDVRFVVPTSPGGGFDRQARLLAPYLSKYLPGNPNVVIDNQEGGGGLVGVQDTFNREADGLQLLQTPVSSHMVQSYVNPEQLSYDMTEFSWVGAYAADVRGLGMHPDLGVEDWDDVVAITEERPIRFATSGRSTSSGIEPAILSETTGLDIEFVDYAGSAESQAGMARGEVDAVLLNFTSLANWVDEGDAVMVMLFGEERQDLVPDVPTALEAGMPEADYEAFTSVPVVGTYRALALSPGTPEGLLQIWRDAFDQAIDDPEYQAEVAEVGEMFGPILDGEGMQAEADRLAEAMEADLETIVGYYAEE
jgi:tripartite-type tricarboxylate transporter receptor subunit TctC